LKDTEQITAYYTSAVHVLSALKGACSGKTERERARPTRALNEACEAYLSLSRAGLELLGRPKVGTRATAMVASLSPRGTSLKLERGCPCSASYSRFFRPCLSPLDPASSGMRPREADGEMACGAEAVVTTRFAWGSLPSFNIRCSVGDLPRWMSCASLSGLVVLNMNARSSGDINDGRRGTLMFACVVDVVRACAAVELRVCCGRVGTRHRIKTSIFGAQNICFSKSNDIGRYLSSK